MSCPASTNSCTIAPEHGAQHECSSTFCLAALSGEPRADASVDDEPAADEEAAAAHRIGASDAARASRRAQSMPGSDETRRGRKTCFPLQMQCSFTLPPHLRAGAGTESASSGFRAAPDIPHRHAAPRTTAGQKELTHETYEPPPAALTATRSGAITDQLILPPVASRQPLHMGC